MHTQIQGIIQKKSASGSRTLPCLAIFFRNFVLIWKCQKWSLNRGTFSISICHLPNKMPFYSSKCPFFFSSFGCCPMILDYSLKLAYHSKLACQPLTKPRLKWTIKTREEILWTFFQCISVEFEQVLTHLE